MFRRGAERTAPAGEAPDRVDSVLGPGISWKGEVGGTGGVRIDGAFDGELAVRGLVVVGEQGRVACKHLRAVSVVVAGSVRGDITAQRVEITRTGRVWGDVVTTSFATEEGAFLRGQIRMEDSLDLGFPPEPTQTSEGE
jgi:cytoskeletal protein CcmA (bactofilin family)